MAIYAIAVLREQDGEVKVRLLSTDKAKCIDVPMKELGFYTQKDDGIRNLYYNSKNELKWKQGSVERYPIIDKQLGSIKNEDAVTVLGVADTETQKYYKICNYTGQTVVLSANDLIEYSKVHKLSNCKLVTKSHKEFISAIEGELETIDTQVKYKIDNDYRYLQVYMPFITSDTLEIPEMVQGRPIMNIESIEITPASSALAIKKLKLNKYIKAINKGLFGSMLNLEEIDIVAKDVDVYERAFTHLSKLRKVNFNTIRATSQYIFYGLANLEEVNCVKPFGYIQSNSFTGCIKLNINSVLKDGVIIIGTKAFMGNMATVNLVIPSTVTTIVDTAFDKCKNLATVEVHTEILSIDTYRKAAVLKGLFNGLGQIDMYINKNTVYDEKRIASNVRIFKREESAKDKKVANKVSKGSILGLDIDPGKIVEKASDIADILMAVEQEEVTKCIVSILQAIMKNGNVVYKSKRYEIGGFKIKISIERNIYNIIKASEVRNIGKFIVVKIKDSLLFIPIDKVILSNRIRNSYSNELLRSESAEAKYLKSVDISDNGKIRLIYEKDNKVSVRYIDEFEIEERV